MVFDWFKKSKKLEKIAKREIIKEEQIDEKEVIKKLKDSNPLTLQERLDIYKIAVREIKQDNENCNYEFNTSDGNYVEINYKFISNHFVVNTHSTWRGYHTIAVFEKDKEQEVKEYCHKEIIKYIKRNTKFLYGKFWHNSVYPFKHKNGGISTVTTLPFLFKFVDPEQEREAEWKRLDVYTKSKINNSRVKHGLSPLEIRL